MLHDRLTIRLTGADTQAVHTIAVALQARGMPFVNRTEVTRAALHLAAEQLTKGTAATD